MAIYRTRSFSFFDKLKNIFSSDKTQEEIIDDSSKEKSLNPVKLDYITFKEGYDSDYYPALVAFGIQTEYNKPDGGWSKIVSFLKEKGMFKRGGNLVGIHELSKKDNINGKNGACVVVLEFSKNTEIDSRVRLRFANNFKWPEDVFCKYNNYYTWYKSGKNI